MALVTKEYLCKNCDVIEIFQQHDKTSKKCPNCKAKIERLISKPLVAKDGSPRTIGSQIELNNKNNKYAREKAMGETTEKKLAGESKFRKLSNASQQQKQRYIDEGVI
jgi:putative FmdB family regulatory protein